VIYRAPRTLEADALAELGRSTFVDTFGPQYAKADLDHYLEEAYAPSVVRRELENPKRLYRVAEDNGTLVAYCKLGFEVTLPWTPIAGRSAMELKQLYVRKVHIGTGVAQTLMQWALEEARARAFDDMILSVYSENLRAQKFYQRYGFTHVGRFDYMVGNHKDDEYLYRLILTP
jgi:diamine N-acetyltransferase